jgi:hypothetical protein
MRTMGLGAIYSRKKTIPHVGHRVTSRAASDAPTWQNCCAHGRTEGRDPWFPYC